MIRGCLITIKKRSIKSSLACRECIVARTRRRGKAYRRRRCRHDRERHQVFHDDGGRAHNIISSDTIASRAQEVRATFCTS
eukprot:SAG11_NODE_14863_length_597_cov_1.038153_1_plen_80_part_01